MDEKINISVDVTPELYELLTELSAETGASEGEVIRKALVLMDLAVDAVRSGGTVTVNEAVAPGGPLRAKEVVGLVASPAKVSAPVLDNPKVALATEESET